MKTKGTPEWIDRRLEMAPAFVLAVLMSALPVGAVDVGDKVRIGGFGGWAAGETDGNEYLAGTEDREYDTVDFTLLVTANVSDQLTISGQIHSAAVDEEIETALDFAFAEWTFSDLLRLRGGFVKHPFGIYTEIFDVGTVRPFFDLPQGLYGPGEFIAEAYQGLGLTGFKQLDNGWGLGYDVYGGEIGLDSTEAANPLPFGDAGAEGEEIDSEEKLKDVLGGRLRFHAPGGNFNFGLSAYSGEPEEEEGGEAAEEEGTTQEVFGLHAEYASSVWTVRFEYVHREGGDEQVEAESAYLEVARYFGDHWQVGARYDWAEFDLVDQSGGFDTSLLEHQDQALTINYWLSPNMVFKLSYHMVDGLLYARPSAVEEPDPDTNLFQLGLQFSF